MRVLAVEDNVGDAILIREAFEELGEGAELTFARDGEGALAILNLALETGENPLPDLILLDLNLPRMHGHEVLEELKESPRWRSIPVFILSSSNAARDVSTAHVLHCNGYFSKPSTFAEAVDLARVFSDFWRRSVHPGFARG